MNTSRILDARPWNETDVRALRSIVARVKRAAGHLGTKPTPHQARAFGVSRETLWKMMQPESVRRVFTPGTLCAVRAGMTALLDDHATISTADAAALDRFHSRPIASYLPPKDDPAPVPVAASCCTETLADLRLVLGELLDGATVDGATVRLRDVAWVDYVRMRETVGVLP